MAGSKQKESQSIRTLHLDKAQIEAVLDDLDNQGVAGESAPDGSKVFPFRNMRLEAGIQSEGGSPARFLVTSRYISQNELAFLHGRYAHVGTKCAVQLTSLHETWEVITGQVATCRHIQGYIHEIVMQFNKAIDVSLYTRAAIRQHVLLVEDEEVSAQITTHYLEELNTIVDHVENGQEAIDKGMENDYDLILMDINMPEVDGWEATKQLRHKGFFGKIVALTGLRREIAEQKCTEHGLDGLLTKPFTEEEISELIDSLIEEPLFSSLANNSKMAAIINGFVEGIPLKIRELHLGLVEKDLKHIEEVARQLKGQGSGCGFESITEAAVVLEDKIAAGETIAVLQHDVLELVRLCRGARPIL